MSPANIASLPVCISGASKGCLFMQCPMKGLHVFIWCPVRGSLLHYGAHTKGMAWRCTLYNLGIEPAYVVPAGRRMQDYLLSFQ